MLVRPHADPRKQCLSGRGLARQSTGRCHASKPPTTGGLVDSIQIEELPYCVVDLINRLTRVRLHVHVVRVVQERGASSTCAVDRDCRAAWLLLQCLAASAVIAHDSALASIQQSPQSRVECSTGFTRPQRDVIATVDPAPVKKLRHVSYLLRIDSRRQCCLA